MAKDLNICIQWRLLYALSRRISHIGNVITGYRLGFSVVFNFRLFLVADQCFLRDGWRDFLSYFSDLCNPLSFCCLSRFFTPHHSA